MRRVLKISPVFVSLALFASLLTSFPMANADEATEKNNYRDNHYNPSDSDHKGPSIPIVGMSIKPAVAGRAVIAGTIRYNTIGAPVMVNPNIYVIWYGTWTNPCTATGNTTPAVVNDVLKGIGPTSWNAINTRYYSQARTGAAKTYVTSAVNWAGCTYDNASLGRALDGANPSTGAVVDRALTNNTLPRDANGLYFVFTSSDVVTSGFVNSTTPQFCGYHSYLNPAYDRTKNIIYSFVGDPGASLASCNGQSVAGTSPNSNPAADAMTSVIAHELVEAVSDPLLNAWYDAAGNENADKCSWVYGTQSTAPNGAKFNVIASGRRFLIQQNWNPDVTTGNCVSGMNSPLIATTSVATTTLINSRAATAFTPVTATGGTAPYTYSISPTLPTGLLFNTATGQVTGTPGAVLASTAFTVTARDAGAKTWDSSFNLIVNNPPPVAATRAVATVSLQSGRNITPVTPVTASAGTAPYTYSISPTLPAGLLFNTATGQITGNPAASLASQVQTVTITDAVSGTASNTFNLVITTPLPLAATVALASKKAMLTKAVASFIPVTATGGFGSNVFTISPTLPAGLTLNASTGAISGTPTAALASTVETIRITDANGAFVTATFTLQVSPALTVTRAVTTLTARRAVAIAPFTPVTAAGSVYTPYVFSISPALPTGLVINSATGQITGTPPNARANARSYTVTVTDGAAFTATGAFSLTIN